MTPCPANTINFEIYLIFSGNKLRVIRRYYFLGKFFNKNINIFARKDN